MDTCAQIEDELAEYGVVMVGNRLKSKWKRKK
jgi:hypothetical protein